MYNRPHAPQPHFNASRPRLALVPALLALTFLAASSLSASAAAPAPAVPAAVAATSQTQAAKMTEMQKVNYLIKAVETSNLTFIRNSSEYDSKKAASHLRDKLNYALKHPKKGVDLTARNFIKLIASGSSLWGTPYRMKFKDGKMIPTGEWLTQRLDELEKGKGPAATTPTPIAKTPPARPVSK